MSTFIERLNQQATAESQPIGFKKATSLTQKRLMIAAEVEGPVLADITKLSLPPDALIIKAEEVEDRLDILTELQQEKQVGIGLRLGYNKKVATVSSSINKDWFFVTSLHNCVVVPSLAIKNSRIMEIDAQIEAEMLKAAAQTGIDAFLLQAEEAWTAELTWLHLIAARRAVNLISKPMLMACPISAQEEELQALWVAGVDGICVSISEPKHIVEFTHLIKRVHSVELPARPPKIGGRIATPYPHGLLSGEEEEAFPPDI